MPLTQLLFSFEGRMRRSHWWAVRLASSLAFVILVMAAAGLVDIASSSSRGAASVLLLAVGLPAIVAYAWVFVATSVKRLHDQDYPGWITALFFVPYVGGLAAVVVLGCLEGTKGPNRFGPSEKYPEAVAETFA